MEQQARSTVLLEEIRSQLKVIAEGYGALVERSSETNARLARLERRVEELELRLVRSARRWKAP
jgi:predicted mannosyl-3-phosphoglycerate phosphatase (HAD superfamily)